MRLGVAARRAAVGSLACLLTFGTASLYLSAADHLEPPTRADPNVDSTPDRAADLADVYAFFDATNLVLAITFGGPAPTNLPPAYDRDVLYTLHISNDGNPATTEFPIKIKFGFDGSKVGVRATGLPNNIVIEGPVETDLSAGGIVLRAGLFDDPFFFDAQGLRESRQMGVLRFNNQRDFFAGRNVTAVVIQIPRSMVQMGTSRVHVSSDTARFGGQI